MTITVVINSKNMPFQGDFYYVVAAKIVTKYSTHLKCKKTDTFLSSEETHKFSVTIIKKTVLFLYIYYKYLYIQVNPIQSR